MEKQATPETEKQRSLHTMKDVFESVMNFSALQIALDIFAFIAMLIRVHHGFTQNPSFRDTDEGKLFIMSLTFVFLHMAVTGFKLLSVQYIGKDLAKDFTLRVIKRSNPLIFLVAVYIMDAKNIKSWAELSEWLLVVGFCSITKTVVKEVEARKIQAGCSIDCKANLIKMKQQMKLIGITLITVLTFSGISWWFLDIDSLNLLSLLYYKAIETILEGAYILAENYASIKIIESKNYKDTYYTRRALLGIVFETVLAVMRMMHLFRVMICIGFNYLFIIAQGIVINEMQKVVFNCVINIEKMALTLKFFMNVLKRLPLVQQDEESAEECSICLEKLVRSRKLECGHLFHQYCLLLVIENGKKTCPLCRTTISKMQRLPSRPTITNPIPNFFGLEY